MRKAALGDEIGRGIGHFEVCVLRCRKLPERTSSGQPNLIAGEKTFVTFEVVDSRASIAFWMETSYGNHI